MLISVEIYTFVIIILYINNLIFVVLRIGLYMYVYIFTYRSFSNDGTLSTGILTCIST